MNIIQKWKEKCLLPSEVEETQLFRPEEAEAARKAFEEGKISFVLQQSLTSQLMLQLI